jgi:hypothetical protein
MGMTFWAVLWVVVFASVGAYVAAVKRRPWHEGIVLGILLGPFGLVLVALFPEGAPAVVPTVSEVSQRRRIPGRRLWIDPGSNRPPHARRGDG